MKKCKKAVQASKKEWSEKETEEARLKLEIQELKKSIEQAEDQIKACVEAIEGT